MTSRRGGGVFPEEGSRTWHPKESTEATTGHEPSAWDDPAPWRELFEALSIGRLEALEQIYVMGSNRMYGLALWRTGNFDDASEVVQEVFVRVTQERARLAEIRDPRWWLLKLTHRMAVDVTRRRRCMEDLDEHSYLMAPTPSPERILDAKKVSGLVRRLSGKQREVVYLRHFAEMSYSEIGQVLGVPTFTAASRYRLALARLRRLAGVTG